MKLLNTTQSDGFPFSFLIENMKIENRTISYRISIAHNDKREDVTVTDINDKSEITSLVLGLFRNRLHTPAGLRYRDGVCVSIKKVDYTRKQIENVMNIRVFNKSVRQIKMEIEKKIRSQSEQ